jgi:hypothetical protein
MFLATALLNAVKPYCEVTSGGLKLFLNSPKAFQDNACRPQ